MPFLVSWLPHQAKETQPVRWALAGQRRVGDRYLYAVPAAGETELAALYDALNPAAGPEPFEPHVTLGLFCSAVEAEEIARIVQRQHLPMRGRVEELALLRREGDGLETLRTVRLDRR